MISAWSRTHQAVTDERASAARRGIDERKLAERLPTECDRLNNGTVDVLHCEKTFLILSHGYETRALIALECTRIADRRDGLERHRDRSITANAGLLSTVDLAQRNGLVVAGVVVKDVDDVILAIVGDQHDVLVDRPVEKNNRTSIELDTP